MKKHAFCRRKSLATNELLCATLGVSALLLTVSGCTESSEKADPPAAVAAPETTSEVSKEIKERFPDYERKTSPDTVLDYRVEVGLRIGDLPEANVAQLAALLDALETNQAKARENPGEWTDGFMPLGANEREYEPSDSELYVSELGSRIQKVVATSTPEERAKAIDAAGRTDTVVEFGEIEFRHVDVIGSGRFFYASEPKPVRVELRS